LATLDPVYAAEKDVEILLVNNGSTDGSAVILEKELAGRNKDVFKIVTVEKNIGYGFGILSGLRAARGEVLSVTHADRQTDPMDVLKAYDLYKAAKNEKTLVKGYRKKRRVTEALFSYAMGLLASIVLRVRLTEINAQPKLFSKPFFYSIEKDAPNDFAFDTYLLYHAKKKGRIIDFPVFFAKRVAGEAKGGSGGSWKARKKLIKRCFAYIFELRRQIKKNERT
jgi:glycosyltransferase involved in cell wall biosynthesis